jgi:hypothetical protein
MLVAALRPHSGREREATRENSGRDGATEMLVIGGLETSTEVGELAEYPSHGGSQGFKSPHLHPTTALVTGLAGHHRRAGVLLEALLGQQTGSNRDGNGPRCSLAARDVIKRNKLTRPSDYEAQHTHPARPPSRFSLLTPAGSSIEHLADLPRYRSPSPTTPATAATTASSSAACRSPPSLAWTSPTPPRRSASPAGSGPCTAAAGGP